MAFARSLPLTDQTRIDWALVIIFYAAVHYVEAYLAKRGIHLRSHASRDSYVARDSVLRQVWNEYQDLKYFGFNARYEFLAFTPHDFTLASQHWDAIELKLKAHL